MARSSEIGVGLAALGIAAGFAAGVFAGRSAARLVEEDFARVAAQTARTGSLERAVRARESSAVGEGEVARYKIAVTQAQPSAGPSDALVTIVEWCDVYGEPCRKVDALLTAALEHRPLEVRRVFRGLGSPTDALVLEVAHAAHEQGKFWELRERLAGLDHSPSLSELERHVEAIGMKWSKVKRALERRTYSGAIAADRALASAVGVRGAAALYVNGRPLDGEITVARLSAMIEEEAARARVLMNDGAAREDIYAEIIKPAAWRRDEPAL